jgi:UPF0755 protein
MMKKIGVYLFLKVFLLFVVIAGITAGLYAYQLYKNVYEPSIFVKMNKETDYLYIPTGAGINTVDSLINKLFTVRYPDGLKMVIERKQYANKVKPGKYLITNGMSNNALIDMLRAGRQEEIEYVLKFHRVKPKLAEHAAKNIEASYGDIMLLLNDEQYLDSIGFNKENIMCIFIPNTYRLFWNTSAEEFMQRMLAEYNKFWTPYRREKAAALGLSPEEAVILASIVDRETKWNDEKPKIAGAYLNRLRIGMRLQADPTVVFAVGDFRLRRVLRKHLDTESPYNTYRNKGLPPGPICTPSINSIESVLYAEKHKYIYFCAKDDFSGYHSFASTLAEHNQNARRFQAALNKKKIYK